MQEKNERRSNEERTRATRTALLAAARRLFVTKGYAETGTPEIVAEAEVTRGALYHHFTDKQDLFRAVVRQEFADVAAEINARSVAAATAREALIAGGVAYVEAMRAPGRVRIMLLDGPAVLGRPEIDAIDAETSAGALKVGLETAIAAGEIAPLPVGALTSLLSAMFDRAALEVAQGAEPADHISVFNAVFTSLGK